MVAIFEMAFSKAFFLKENCCILNQILLTFVPKGTTNNKWTAKWMDRQMDEQTDGQPHSLSPPTQPLTPLVVDKICM